jgi:hypothetical protein
MTAIVSASKVIQHKVVGEVKIINLGYIYLIEYTPPIDMRGTSIWSSQLTGLVGLKYKPNYTFLHKLSFSDEARFKGKAKRGLDGIQEYLDTLTPEYFEELQKEYDAILAECEASVAAKEAEKQQVKDTLDALH